MSANTRKVRLPAFFSLPPDSPSLSKALRQSILSSASPLWIASSTRPSQYQLQITTENSTFGVMSLSSLPSGAPALCPLLAAVPGSLTRSAGCISKRMVCFRLPLLGLLSHSSLQQRRYQVLSESMVQTSACASSSSSSRHRPRSVLTRFSSSIDLEFYTPT